MVAKIVVLYGHPQDAEAFDSYYVNTHAPIAKAVPGLRSFTASVGPVGTPAGPSDYYRVATLPAVSAELVAQGMDPATPAATIADAGMPSQRSVRATLATIAAETTAADITPPAITVIGAVAGFEA